MASGFRLRVVTTPPRQPVAVMEPYARHVLVCVGGFCIKLCQFKQCGDPTCTADEGSCVHFPRDPEGVGECSVAR